MTILFAILLFSFLIFIHELGHFLTAKASGVQVNEFSLFMGPAIFKKQIGETTYALRCIPIGGYCAMEGEDEDTDSPRSFQKAKWWKRLIILVAGSFMNFVTGFLLMAIVFSPAAGFYVPVVDYAEPNSYLFHEEGLQVGDRILEVDGEKIYVSSDFSTILSLNPGDVHDLVVERGGEKIVLKDFEMKKQSYPNEKGGTDQRYGFSFRAQEATFGNKLKFAWLNTVDTVRITRLSLQMLLTGKASFSDVSGPVGIVDQMNQVASQSEKTVDKVLDLLYFGAFIAINLAVMNLLPIPALDGGRALGLLLTTAIEGITHKKVNPKYEGMIHAIGMILLLALMAVILFKDVFTIFTR